MGCHKEVCLGQYCFLFRYVNELLELDGLVSDGKLFADDAKVYRVVQDASDTDILQEDLNKLSEWSSMWKLKFNSSINAKLCTLSKGTQRSCIILMASRFKERLKGKLSPF